MSPDGTLEQVESPPYVKNRQIKKREQKPSSPEVVSYSFHELPKWFDENPDAMCLCEMCLDELDKFVCEVEKMVKKKVLSPE